MFRDVSDEEERIARELIDDRARGLRLVGYAVGTEATEAAFDELLGSFKGRRKLARWRAGC